MRFRLGSAALAWGMSTLGYGATVAIVDSGVDTKHRDLSPRVWSNPGETAGNGVDDEGNGFVDDVYGWNFAENNAQVIDYQYLNTFPEDCEKFFKLQGKILLGTATEEEKQWVKQKREDQSFVQQLMTFGNFVHGSHVAGIASGSRSVERLVAIKIIPTKTPGLGATAAAPLSAERVREQLQTLEDDNPLADLLLKLFLDQIIAQNSTTIQNAFKYAAAEGADVANGSFGISQASAETAVEALLKMLLGRDPTAEEKKKWARYLVEGIGAKCKESIDAAPKTLFVFAAGNDGSDNDASPVSPAGIKSPNVVTVAATLSLSKLASFSNWGATSVDVAAPGVVINSTIPGDKYLELSGTSMASPEVADTAALVKDANPALDPAGIKKVLMGTVDKKDWLQGKVISGGIVNRKRAVAAATLSKETSLDDAIAKAREQVGDAAEINEGLLTADDSEIFALPLPSLFR